MFRRMKNMWRKKYFIEVESPFQIFETTWNSMKSFHAKNNINVHIWIMRFLCELHQNWARIFCRTTKREAPSLFLTIFRPITSVYAKSGPWGFIKTEYQSFPVTSSSEVNANSDARYNFFMAGFMATKYCVRAGSLGYRLLRSLCSFYSFPYPFRWMSASHCFEVFPNEQLSRWLPGIPIWEWEQRRLGMFRNT